ncbi:hypothetical protein BLOT_006322, partial [Blomia tropicalis]
SKLYAETLLFDPLAVLWPSGLGYFLPCFMFILKTYLYMKGNESQTGTSSQSPIL